MANQNRRGFLKNSVILGAGMPLFGVPRNDDKKNSKGAEEMSVFDVIHRRRSVRSYQSTPVPEEHITKIIDSARMAPTAGNQQPWKFVVIGDRVKLDALKQACIDDNLLKVKEGKKPTEEEFKETEKNLISYYNKIFSAPVFIVVLVDTESKWPSYNKHDGPLAAGYLMLAARAMGYGTVYFTDSIPDEVTRKVLAIPERYERICITPLGVPEEWPETPSKKGLNTLVVHEPF